MITTPKALPAGENRDPGHENADSGHRADEKPQVGRLRALWRAICGRYRRCWRWLCHNIGPAGAAERRALELARLTGGRPPVTMVITCMGWQTANGRPLHTRGCGFGRARICTCGLLDHMRQAHSDKEWFQKDWSLHNRELVRAENLERLRARGCAILERARQAQCLLSPEEEAELEEIHKRIVAGANP